MTTQNLDFDDAVPVSTDQDGDILVQQRAAGLSIFFTQVQVSPIAIVSGTIRPQEYLDGMVLAMNTVNLVGLDGGAGKSTSVRHAGVEAAATGWWRMLGSRKHSSALRVAMIFGEESGEQIAQSIASIPGALDHYKTAIATGRLLIISMEDFMAKSDCPERIFNKDGQLTATGTQIFQELAGFRPDVLVLDTLGSISESEYLDALSPRNTISTLNRFCSKSRCTAIAFLHLTKDAGSRFTAESKPDELLAMSRGSAQMKNSARSLIVATRAPAGMFPGVEIEAGDEIWVGTTKCNLQNAKYNYKFFPIVRDSKRMILTAQSTDGGKSLADAAEQAKRESFKLLIDYIPHLIRAASDARKPFPVSTKNRFSLQTMLTGPMSGYFEERLSPGIITSALEELLKGGKIVECSDSRAAGAMVYCVPGGNFADPGIYKSLTGEELKIRKGDYPVDELKDRMHELHDAAQRGKPIPQASAALEALEQKADGDE